MPSRMYWIPALILWLASTGWLLSTKILPALTSGSPPDYGEILPNTAVTDPEPIRWAIRWKNKDIGWAENKISRSIDGTGRITSEVQFEQLPIDELIRDAMGVLGWLTGTLTEDVGPLDLHVLTHLDFDNYGTLSHFVTNVDVGSIRDLLQIEGHVMGEKLDLAARVKADTDLTNEIYRNKQITLPPDAVVADTFSPRPRLANLRIGQTWTYQSYQPLMPHSPLTLIEARVESEELIQWHGKMVPARKVSFRRDSGSGVSSTRRPVSETWVMHDGTVLRQDLWLANVKVQFLRVESPRGREDAEAQVRPEAPSSD